MWEKLKYHPASGQYQNNQADKWVFFFFKKELGRSVRAYTFHDELKIEPSWKIYRSSSSDTGFTVQLRPQTETNCCFFSCLTVVYSRTSRMGLITKRKHRMWGTFGCRSFKVFIITPRLTKGRDLMRLFPFFFLTSSLSFSELICVFHTSSIFYLCF